MVKRILTVWLLFVLLVIAVGMFLLFSESKYGVLEKVRNRVAPYQFSTGGEACLVKLKERGIKYRNMGTSAENDVCTIYDAVRIRNFPNTKMSGAVTLNCQTAIDLADWFEEIGAKEVKHMGSYVCRKIRGSSHFWSQHSFGSAVDISHINGASLKEDWFKENENSKYLKQAGKDACHYFSNVLTPDSNAAHHDHFHLDNGPRFGSCGPAWINFINNAANYFLN